MSRAASSPCGTMSTETACPLAAIASAAWSAECSACSRVVQETCVRSPYVTSHSSSSWNTTKRFMGIAALSRCWSARGAVLLRCRHSDRDPGRIKAKLVPFCGQSGRKGAIRPGFLLTMNSSRQRRSGLLALDHAGDGSSAKGLARAGEAAKARGALISIRLATRPGGALLEGVPRPPGAAESRYPPANRHIQRVPRPDRRAMPDERPR